MFHVLVYVAGRKKPSRMTCRAEHEVQRLVSDIRARGFDELVGPAECPHTRVFWPAHRVMRIEVKLEEHR